MKSILLIIIIISSLATPCFSLDGNNDYPAWFNTFITDFKEYSRFPNAQKKTNLTNLFRMKPLNNSGKYYNLWFDKAFCWFIDNTNTLSNQSESEKMKYIMDAMPDLDNTGEFYKQYFQYGLKKFKDFMPVLDDSEKKGLEYFKRAKPKNSDNDYIIWFSEYNRIKEDYGPVYSADENFILQLLMGIRPAEENNQNAVYSVSGETLLKIKYLIQNNEPNTAANEIDKILRGAQQS